METVTRVMEDGTVLSFHTDGQWVSSEPHAAHAADGTLLWED